MQKLPLTTPITIGKKTITELSFRGHTTAEDYLAFDNRGGVAQFIALIASLSGTDEAVIKQMSGKDYKRALRIVDELLDADDIDDDKGLSKEEIAEKKSVES